MSRNKKNRNQGRTVTVHFDESFAIAIDNYVVGLGLESRAAGVIALVEAGMSLLPLDAMIGRTLQQAVTEMKRAEIEALVVHFEGRAKIYAPARER